MSSASEKGCSSELAEKKKKIALAIAHVMEDDRAREICHVIENGSAQVIAKDPVD